MFAAAKQARSTKGGLRWSNRENYPRPASDDSLLWQLSVGGTNSHFLSRKLQKDRVFWTMPDALLVAYMSSQLMVWKFTSEKYHYGIRTISTHPCRRHP